MSSDVDVEGDDDCDGEGGEDDEDGDDGDVYDDGDDGGVQGVEGDLASAVAAGASYSAQAEEDE